MRRFHQEIAIMRSRARLAGRVLYMAELDLGRYRKRHPLDCGGRCGLCHGDKLFSPKRRGARKRAAIADQLAE